MSGETLADRLDVDADELSLECTDCDDVFFVSGSRRHTDCPNCHGSNTDFYL